MDVTEIASARAGLLAVIAIAEHANDDYYQDLRIALDLLCDAALLREAELSNIGTAE